jgi:hypothetical protein
MTSVINEDWREKLILAAQKDLRMRALLADRGALHEGYHAEMEAIHLENASLLLEAFQAIGWPGRSVVDDDGAEAAFLILQHAISRPDVQRRGLALLLDAVPNGDGSALDAAYLGDRIAMYEGRGQLFGTQFDWDADGMLSPAPIAEPATVDSRRASLGLIPIAEAVAEMRARAAGEGPPSDLAVRRVEFEAWLKRVGWRS